MIDIDKLSVEELTLLVEKLKNKTKECPICHQVFPLTTEHFNRSKKGVFASYCRKCSSEKSKQDRINMTPAQKMKRAVREAEHRREKEASRTPAQRAEHKEKRRIKAIEYNKKVKKRCENDPVYQKKIDERNRANQKRASDRRKAENPEKYRLENIERAKKHRELYPNYQKEYYQKNKERIIQQSTLYNKKNRNKNKFDNNFSELEVALLKALFHSQGTDIPQLLKFHSEGAIKRKAKELGL